MGIVNGMRGTTQLPGEDMPKGDPWPSESALLDRRGRGLPVSATGAAWPVPDAAVGGCSPAVIRGPASPDTRLAAWAACTSRTAAATWAREMQHRESYGWRGRGWAWSREGGVETVSVG
jgi:hypothetical protein